MLLYLNELLIVIQYIFLVNLELTNINKEELKSLLKIENERNFKKFSNNQVDENDKESRLDVLDYNHSTSDLRAYRVANKLFFFILFLVLYFVVMKSFN